MLYIYAREQQAEYLSLLQQSLPNLDQNIEIVGWPTSVPPEDVTYIAAWMPPEDFFRPYKNLKTIFALGAGVDKFLARTDIAPEVQIVRLTDAGMAQQMIEYCLYGVLHYQRQMDFYAFQQQQNQWQPRDTCLARDVRVTVLGLGELGCRVATFLSQMGYVVSGWSRTQKEVEGVTCYAGQTGLENVLSQTDVLFSVLPSTPETQHLLNQHSLALIPKGSAIINAGRGSLIDEPALLALLEQAHFRFVLLDVYAKEPLDPAHPFWQHPRVIMTPHVAADTIVADAVTQICDNLRRIQQGQTPTGLVSRSQGY